jgi:enoyl-CoA hydratase/carnithine racemase
VEAPEALALGLVNRVEAEPDAVAEEIVADIVRREEGSPAPGISEMLGVSGIKLVMTAGGLLDRLQAERAANQSAWARAIGPELSPAEDR